VGEKEEKVAGTGFTTILTPHQEIGTPLLSHLIDKQKPAAQEAFIFHVILLTPTESEALNR